MFRSELLRTSLYAAIVVVAVAVPAGALGQDPPLAQAVERDGSRELSCAPQSPLIEPIMTKRVVAGSERGRSLFAAGDTVVVNAGTDQGLQNGQQYYVRRLVTDRFSEPLPGFVPISVHTAGWVRIVDAQPNMSIATINQVCDGVMIGDYLEAFTPPAVPEAQPAGEPDFAQPAHLILGDERRQMGAAGSLMVMDRGSDHGLRPGQRLTIFRYTLNGAGPVLRLGTATIALVKNETAVVRIDKASQAIFVGDLVAIHRANDQ